MSSTLPELLPDASGYPHAAHTEPVYLMFFSPSTSRAAPRETAGTWYLVQERGRNPHGPEGRSIHVILSLNVCATKKKRRLPGILGRSELRIREACLEMEWTAWALPAEAELRLEVDFESCGAFRLTST